METIVDEYGNVFEVVNSVPDGFEVWNIPQTDEFGEYVPLFEPMRPDDAGCTDVNPDTLKAVMMTPDAAARLHRAACYGIRSLRDAERAAANKRSGFLSGKKRELANEAMADFRELWSR